MDEYKPSRQTYEKLLWAVLGEAMAMRWMLDRSLKKYPPPTKSYLDMTPKEQEAQNYRIGLEVAEGYMWGFAARVRRIFEDYPDVVLPDYPDCAFGIWLDEIQKIEDEQKSWPYGIDGKPKTDKRVPTHAETTKRKEQQDGAQS